LVVPLLYCPLHGGPAAHPTCTLGLMFCRRPCCLASNAGYARHQGGLPRPIPGRTCTCQPCSICHGISQLCHGISQLALLRPTYPVTPSVRHPPWWTRTLPEQLRRVRVLPLASDWHLCALVACSPPGAVLRQASTSCSRNGFCLQHNFVVGARLECWWALAR
jgi:hypothetical protein